MFSVSGNLFSGPQHGCIYGLGPLVSGRYSPCEGVLGLVGFRGHPRRSPLDSLEPVPPETLTQTGREGLVNPICGLTLGTVTVHKDTCLS